jgi:hydroxyacylglutathione hydrolase
LDRVKGWFTPDAVSHWVREGGTPGRVEQLSPSELAGRTAEFQMLDVRGRSEWESGHLSGATLIPLAELPDRLEEVSKDRPVAVHCQGGSRSAIAASLLLARGHRAVANVPGGLSAWEQEGLPVEKGVMQHGSTSPFAGQGRVS